MRSGRSKATAISKEVAEEVIERDGGRCVVCGKYEYQIAHYIPRSLGGLGIPPNLVLLCANCHFQYDNGRLHDEIGKLIVGHLSALYADWAEIQKTYKKG